MKRFHCRLFATLTLFLTIVVTSWADTDVDAQSYFDGQPWGWATCADADGSAYVLDGGMRAEQPRTIVLKSNGADNAMVIQNAINQNDIIVLDGSNGQFTISSQMKINNAKNKTIVGRNNAVLATEFFLTQEDITYLKTQGLEGLSSTDQYTGTLPDGTTMTCDRRAFFTKKAMMELSYKKTGAYTLPNNAGIFQFGSTCENIIVRNLTLHGPGAVDIDGSDLLYDAYATHLWVDHCTFIDSQDGALDTRGGFNTYTWNHFYYTDRSYSHAYTCGLGWVSNHSAVLRVTWGQNIWGAGCQRRLPQADDAFLHLVNNYHNCPGNSAGMTLNSYVKALVEGNYAAEGVKLPLTGSGDNRVIYALDNNFSYTSTSTNVALPYTYTKFPSCNDVPTILTAKHGAGATLDSLFMPLGYNTLNAETFGFYTAETEALAGNAIALPFKNLVGAYYTLESSDSKVVSVSDNGEVKAVGAGTANVVAVVDDPIYGKAEASVKVVVTQASAFESDAKWDFSVWSEETKQNLAADANWTGSSTCYNNVNVLDQVLLTANGQEIAETKGLKISSPAEKMELNIGGGYIRFNKDNSGFVIPNLKKNDKVVVTWKSANSSSERGFNTSNLNAASLVTTAKATKDALVLADGDVSLSVAPGGIYVYCIEIQRQGADGIEQLTQTSSSDDVICNLQGVRCAKGCSGLHVSRGRVILVK